MAVEVIWLSILGISLLGAIMSGMPVMLAISGVPFILAVIASLFGHFDLSFLAAYPQRIIGVMNNPLLIAIPLFVLMGILLEQSKQAEKLLRNLTQLLGQTRSTLTIAVLFVSTLIAASTGIIGATIVMLGLISLPTMLKSGISTRLSSGLICASGTLGQIIPPSIVLILLGDQISNAYLEAQQTIGNFAPEPVSVGDLFAGALIPGFILVVLYGLYCLFVLNWGNERSGVKTPLFKTDQQTQPALILLAEIIPPVLLIFSVLGSILLGIATPTEAASIGVAGTILIAANNLEIPPKYTKTVVLAVVILIAIAILMQRQGLTSIGFSLGHLNYSTSSIIAISIAILIGLGLLYTLYGLLGAGVLRTSLTKTTQISAMIFGIIIAASMLSLIFRGFEGDELVASLLTGLPGGHWGLLFVTMVVIFFLGFVLEFVEIVFIVVPIVGPILLQTDIHPVWFAILIALNIQTSFLTPPFGFALFYYRSVAPSSISTVEIYKSVIPFVILQVITIGIVIAFPLLATWLPDALFH